MTEATKQRDNRVARNLLGYFVDGDYREVIQLEYRYAVESGFTLYTRIHDREYLFKRRKLYEAMSDLLDTLPVTSAIVIYHTVLASYNGARKIVNLEEWLRPYKIRNAATVLYQLKLTFGDNFIETGQYTEFGGHFGDQDYGGPAEELRARLGSNMQLHICCYCKHLVEYNDYGGTDYRHDQLYCFRDNPEALKHFRGTHPKQQGRELWLSQGTADMDALHSCSAFTYWTLAK